MEDTSREGVVELTVRQCLLVDQVFTLGVDQGSAASTARLLSGPAGSGNKETIGIGRSHIHRLRIDVRECPFLWDLNF